MKNEKRKKKKKKLDWQQKNIWRWYCQYGWRHEVNENIALKLNITKWNESVGRKNKNGGRTFDDLDEGAFLHGHNQSTTQQKVIVVISRFRYFRQQNYRLFQNCWYQDKCRELLQVLGQNVFFFLICYRSQTNKEPN